MDIAISNCRIITMDENHFSWKNATIVIEEDKITDIGKNIAIPKGCEKIDASGCVVIPGLVNAHTHAAMALLRGYADDLDLQTWLNDYIWPLEATFGPDDIYLGAKLCAVEAALAGCTVLNSMYHFSSEEAKGISKAGIRGTVGHVCFSWRKKHDLQETEKLAREWHGKKRIRVSVDPHAPYTVDPEYYKELRDLTTELNSRYGTSEVPIIWHTHLAETEDEMLKVQRAAIEWEKQGIEVNSNMLKRSPIEYLDILGVLLPNTGTKSDVVAAHCVSLTDRDLKIIANKGIRVSHNPTSNLKLASGITKLSTMLDNNALVALGTDGPTLTPVDMFGTMKLASLLQKGINSDPTAIPGKQALKMATLDGARALSWDKEIGSLEVGKKADLVLVNFRKPHLSPVFSEISHLVNAVNPGDVRTTIVDGDIIVEDGQILTVDVEKLLDDVAELKEDILSRLDP